MHAVSLCRRSLRSLDLPRPIPATDRHRLDNLRRVGAFEQAFRAVSLGQEPISHGVHLIDLRQRRAVHEAQGSRLLIDMAVFYGFRDSQSGTTFGQAVAPLSTIFYGEILCHKLYGLDHGFARVER